MTTKEATAVARNTESRHAGESTIRRPGLLVILFLSVFLAVSGVVVVQFDSYFTDFWKIRNCEPSGYDRGDFMTSCAGINVDRYAFGSIYLGSQKDAVENARSADVVVFGNSRTMRSFSTDAIDEYFKEKGLSYVVLASEGSGFRSAVLTAEAMDLNPRILLVNNEIFYADSVSDAFRDLVDFPDRYSTRFDFFNAAQRFQKWSCESGVSRLESFMCNGRTRANWRSAETGRFDWDLVADPAEQEVVEYDPNSRSQLADRFLSNAIELFEVGDFDQSCPILYLVESPVSSPVLMDAMAAEIGVGSAFAGVQGLDTYDGSHLDRPNSERWAEEFVKKLDPVVDQCLAGELQFEVRPELRARLQGPSAGSESTASQSGQVARTDLAAAADDVVGESDFEQWRELGVVVTDKAATAPDGMQTADVIASIEPPGRLQNVLRDTPIPAGTTMRFGGWFWSTEASSMTLQIVRSCSSETEVETVRDRFELTPEPQRFEVELTFDLDHACALVQLAGIEADASVSAWNARVDYFFPDE